MKERKMLWGGLAMMLVFAVWTVAVRYVDVRAIGPGGSRVGFGGMNGIVHGISGVHMGLYVVTDWLGIIPFAVAAGFAALGLWQWVRRRKICRVDRSILVLGVFYAAVIGLYVLFEIVAVNYRPILINGVLETSYPSSTTMLTLCVMPTAAMQLNGRIRNAAVRRCTVFAITAFTLFMVIGRLVSGVHWFSDIIGGALISSGLVMMYKYFCSE